MIRFIRVFLLFWLSAVILLVGCFLRGAFFLPMGVRARARAFGTMIWARGCCAIMNIHLETSGWRTSRETLFIVSNHSSYLDIIILGSLFPAAFIAKQEVRSWPLLGLLTSLSGAIFVDRTSKTSSRNTIREIEERQEHGVHVVLFPEGTTTDGSDVQAFTSSLFGPPADRGTPVLPVSIAYGGDAGGEIAWYGDMSFFPHFWSILGMRRIDVTVHVSPVIQSVTSLEKSKARKHLCACAYQFVRDGHQKLTSGVTGAFLPEA